jgi:hypothetical protein
MEVKKRVQSKLVRLDCVRPACARGTEEARSVVVKNLVVARKVDTLLFAS